MISAIFYVISKTLNMPLGTSFITNEQTKNRVDLMVYARVCTYLVILFLQASCGATRWHSIQEIPAEEKAYIRDSVYVSGDYIRNATITEIDGKPYTRENGNLVDFDVGTHTIKILCSEARGSFNSRELAGQAKTLTFEAKIQRTYIAGCFPYTHWWIEDSENK